MSFLLEQVMEILSECINFKGTPQSICNALSGRQIYVTKARLTQVAEDADLVQVNDTAQKVKFSIKGFFSKCDQICRKLRIWLHLLKTSLMENFIFCAV